METLIESFFSNADGTLPLKVLAVILTVGIATIYYMAFSALLKGDEDTKPLKREPPKGHKVITTITTTIVTEIK